MEYQKIKIASKMSCNKCYIVHGKESILVRFNQEEVHIKMSNFLHVLSFKGTTKREHKFIIQFLNYFYFLIA